MVDADVKSTDTTDSITVHKRRQYSLNGYPLETPLSEEPDTTS